MHRIDLYRAINQPYPADASHDGGIVADIIAEWATTHTDPFTLHARDRLAAPTPAATVSLRSPYSDRAERV